MKKKYFITALSLHREVFTSPDDKDFGILMQKYEQLKEQANLDDIQWVKAAKKLNRDFTNYVKTDFTRPPFENETSVYGVEVYSIQDMPLPSKGWKQPSLVGLEFTNVPFDEVEEHILSDLNIK